MKINIQSLNFDSAKINFYNSLDEVDYLTVGDFSCIKRNIFFLNTDLLNKFSLIKKKLFLQLPLVVRENELDLTKNFIKKVHNCFDGFITGDLGIVKFLELFPKKVLIYTTNVTNKELSGILKNDFSIDFVRPLMYKRTYINEEIAFPKDVVVYGNMMINCATFCYHSENDLVENCKFGCKSPRPLIMNNEKLHLVGRSLLTENRFDIIKNIDRIKDLEMATIMDFDLSKTEIQDIIKKISKDSTDEVSKIVKVRN